MRAVILIVLAVAAGGPMLAQPAEPDPHNLAGTWQLNTWLTDSSDQIEQELRGDLGPIDPAAEVFAIPDEGERGAMGGRMGRRGSQRPIGRGKEPPRVSKEDQLRLESVLALVRQPATTLTITQAGGSVTIADPVRGSHTFQINGTKEKQTFGSGVVQSTTRWEGPQLITDYDAGKGVTLRFSYMLAPPTNELLIRITVMTSGNEAAPFTVKHVYDRASR